MLYKLYYMKVWDEIEQQMESGVDDTIDFKDVKQGKNWFMGLTREEDSQVYTILSAAEWELGDDFETCKDALKSVADNIKQKIETK